MVQKTLSNQPIKTTTKAHELAKGQRDIGVAEFFAKNKHLLGFDNKRKALMTTIKEAVDNSLDACEEAKILPELIIEVIDMNNDRFKVIIEDNGPGIVKKQIPKIFAKLLYGSKFHKLKESRGQQGIGISAAVMYSQLTTGRAAKITSTIGKNYPAQYFELMLDTKTNMPKIFKDEQIEWEKEHGTRIELDIEASYHKGSQSIDEFLKQTAITNPHATIIYTTPKAEQIIFARASNELPKESIEIKPHPYGVELGIMQDMLETTDSKTLQSFLSSEFCKVGSGTAKTICENSALLPKTKPNKMSRETVETLMKGIKDTKLRGPPTNCISPIGPEILKRGLKKEIEAEFYVTATRPPSVYKGNPFQVEAGIAYGGDQKSDKSVNLLRFANRVPLLFQQSAGAFFKGTTATNWRQYGLSQSQRSLPVGPCTILIHIASVWVPFTSESKEAVAHYPEILKEIKLALQECGRQLASYIRKKKKLKDETKKRDYIQKFIPHVSEALQEILKFPDTDKEKNTEFLKELLKQERGELMDLTKHSEVDV